MTGVLLEPYRNRIGLKSQPIRQSRKSGDDARQAVKALLVSNELRSPVALMVMQIRLSALHGFSADTP